MAANQRQAFKCVKRVVNVTRIIRHMSKFSFILCDPLESFGSLEGFASVLRTLKQIGFRGVEFNITANGLADVESLLQLVETLDLPVVSLLTGANYFSHGLCLSSPNVDIRRTTVERLCQFTSVAARFGAVLVVGQMQGFVRDEPIAELAIDRIETALRRVAVAAEESGTTVVLEPVNHLQCGFHNTLDAVMNLTERIGSERLKPMLDSFHMNIEEVSMLEPLQRVGKNLGHFHLCESNGGPLGSGHLNVGSILTTLDSIDYRGFVSVKVYRCDWESSARSTMNHLRTLGLV